VVRGESVAPAPEWWSQGLLVLSVAAAALLMRRWRPILSGLVALSIVVALGALDWLLFLRMNLWLPVTAPALAALTIYLSYGVVAYFAERRRKGEIRRAFSLLDERCQQLLRILTADPPPPYDAIGDLLAMPHGSIGPTRRRCLERLRMQPPLRDLIEEPR